jgi:hypothetical protein
MDKQILVGTATARFFGKTLAPRGKIEPPFHFVEKDVGRAHAHRQIGQAFRHIGETGIDVSHIGTLRRNDAAGE